MAKVATSAIGARRNGTRMLHACIPYGRQTDRQTDKQTDRQTDSDGSLPVLSYRFAGARRGHACNLVIAALDSVIGTCSKSFFR